MNVKVPHYLPLVLLVALLEQLDPNDDEILLNQKLKNILQCWKNECNSGAEVEEIFKCVYSKCLEDASVATKVVTMVSYSFISNAVVHDVKIWHLFITRMQNDFENRKHLQATNPTGFRNSVRMLGEFYHKSRLGDGRSIKFLATPIVCYFEMLLETAQPADLELFTSLLYLNGTAIKTYCPEKMQDLLMQVRHLLLNNTNLTQVCRTWMLLALDVVCNHFGLLPNELQKFYQEQLGDKAMGNFQGIHSALSIQTSHSNKESNDWDSAEDHNPNVNNREKVGRPILGAGTANKNMGSGKAWGGSKKERGGGRSNKEWDHDDRFDY